MYSWSRVMTNPLQNMVVRLRIPYKIASWSRVMRKENNENAKLIEMAMAEIFNPK